MHPEPERGGGAKWVDEQWVVLSYPPAMGNIYIHIFFGDNLVAGIRIAKLLSNPNAVGERRHSDN